MLLLELFPAIAKAQLSCQEQVYEVFYDGCLLPDDPANPHPWNLSYGGEGGESFIYNCQLVLSANRPLAYIMYHRIDEAFQTTASYRMEAMVKVENFLLEGSYVPVEMTISDGQKMVKIMLAHLGGPEDRYLMLCDRNWQCLLHPLDWSAYHQYGMEVKKDEWARFYLDGAVIYHLAYDDLMDPGPYGNLPNITFFTGAESVTWWDWVRYETCAQPPSENRRPVADAGADFEATAGQFVRLDGSRSYDPDGDEITFRWFQTEGPRVTFDDPTSSTPGFIVPQAVDLSTLRFSLVVSDGRLDSSPDEVIVLVHTPAPDEDIAGLLSSVQGSGLNPGQLKRLERALQDALSTNDCAAKLSAIEDFISQVGQGRGRWISEALADQWLDEARTLAMEIGPCTRSCREEGGIEGTNLAGSSSIAFQTGGNIHDPNDESFYPSPELAIDGEASTAWIVPGVGHEIVIDLGAKQKITGIRVVSPVPSTYRLYAWDNLANHWVEVARERWVTDATMDICDTATRYIRYLNERAGCDYTAISEIEIYGHRSRQNLLEWAGSHPELYHAAGRAQGDSWIINPDDGQNVVMSTGPHVMITPGKRWVEFWLRFGEPVLVDEAVAMVSIIKEQRGKSFILAAQKVYPFVSGMPIGLEFQAEAGAKYSFEVFYFGGTLLSLDKIILKDYPGHVSTTEMGFLVEQRGRRISIEESNHALAGYVFHFLPGSIQNASLMKIALAQDGVIPGGGAPLSSAVRISAPGRSLPFSGQLHIHVPLDHQKLHAVGIGPKDIHLKAMSSNGAVYDLGANYGGNWRITEGSFMGAEPVDLAGRGIIFQVIDIGMPHPGLVPFGPAPPPLEGFAKDYQEYNVFYFPMERWSTRQEGGQEIVFIEDESANGNDGKITGNVSRK